MWAMQRRVHIEYEQGCSQEGRREGEGEGEGEGELSYDTTQICLWLCALPAMSLHELNLTALCHSTRCIAHQHTTCPQYQLCATVGQIVQVRAM